MGTGSSTVSKSGTCSEPSFTADDPELGEEKQLLQSRVAPNTPKLPGASNTPNTPADADPSPACIAAAKNKEIHAKNELEKHMKEKENHEKNVTKVLEIESEARNK